MVFGFHEGGCCDGEVFWQCTGCVVKTMDLHARLFCSQRVREFACWSERSPGAICPRGVGRCQALFLVLHRLQGVLTVSQLFSVSCLEEKISFTFCPLFSCFCLAFLSSFFLFIFLCYFCFFFNFEYFYSYFIFFIHFAFFFFF